MAEPLSDFCERLIQGDKVLVAGLGDSLTDGWMVQEGYFDRFCDELSVQFPQANIQRLNSGVPGSLALEGLRRLDSVLAAEPDLVLVQFGLNDCFSGVALPDFEQSYAEITEKILQHGALPFLLTSCPVLDPEFNQQISAFYGGILSLAGKKNVPSADLAGAWEDGQRRNPRLLHQDDGVHPNDEGHQVMAQALGKAVTELRS